MSQVMVGGAVAHPADHDYAGAHYPRDVIGGAVLGCVWGILATLVDPYWFGLGFR